MLIEKLAGSRFTDSLPCGRPRWLLDPAAAAVEAVELAAPVDFPGLLSFPAVATAPHAPITARLAASASVATQRIRDLTRFPPIVPPVQSLPFAQSSSPRGAFLLLVLIRWPLLLSRKVVYLELGHSMAGGAESRLCVG